MIELRTNVNIAQPYEQMLIETKKDFNIAHTYE